MELDNRKKLHINSLPNMPDGGEVALSFAQWATIIKIEQFSSYYM